jgi:hypothetical protein
MILHFYGVRFCLFLLSISFYLFEGGLLAEEQKKVVAPAFEGKILSMEIAAESLALVVDVSSSMRPVLPSIRRELRQKMPRNPTLHVLGTGIERPRARPQIEKGVAPETITAINTLATLSTATTILWITDMADPPNVDGVASLQELLNDRGLQLLLISFGNRPPPSVQKVIESREGYWKLVAPETLR